MKLTDEQLQFYAENGYIVIKKIIPKEKIDSILKYVGYIISLEAKNDPTISNDIQILLNQGLIKIKQNYPSSNSWIYQTINNSNEFKKFIFNSNVDSIAYQLLGVDDMKKLAVVNPVLRIDVPNDSKNKRDWHQESNYFTDVKDGKNGVVVWMPFNDVSEKNGSVILCPGSHKEGSLNSTHISAESGKSEQFVTPPEFVKKYDCISVICERGDVAFLNTDLIHKSGDNSSNQVRYTTQIRFFRLDIPDYNPPISATSYQNYERLASKT